MDDLERRKTGELGCHIEHETARQALVLREIGEILERQDSDHHETTPSYDLEGSELARTPKAGRLPPMASGSYEQGMPWPHAFRDLVFMGIALLFWQLDASLRTGTVASVLVSISTGVATALCGYLAHEWGHLIGARIGRSVVRLPASPTEIFLFNFDSDRNGREQFLIMSIGGYVASVLVVVFLLATVPLATLAGAVALGLTAAGIVATAVLEIPPFVHVWRGGALPRGGAYVSELDA